MPRYRAYSEQLDRLQYLSYNYQRIPNTAETADPKGFHLAIQQLKITAQKTGKNLGSTDILTQVIRELIQNDAKFSNWCRHKSVSIPSIFPTASDPTIPIELAELIAFIYMVEKAHAILPQDSFDNLNHLISALDKHSKAIVNSVKLHAKINFKAHCMRTKTTSPELERTLSLLTEQSYVESGEEFHAACANEFASTTKLLVKSVFTSCTPRACSQFFALRDQQQKTPLIAATIFGMQQAVLQILKQSETKKDIDILINAVDDQGHTALDYAFLLGYTQLVPALLKAGAQFSSPDMIYLSQQSEYMAAIFQRAILCPERHATAQHNYLYLNEGVSYPIMVTDDANDPDHEPTWRFVIMHPQNSDALTLMATKPSIVTEESRIEFHRLRTLKSTTTFAKQRLQALQEPSFLRKLVFALVRMGRVDETRAVLDLYPDLDLLHNDDKVNILHACTNSYAISSQFVSIRSQDFTPIIQGRIQLAQYLIETHPELLSEKTKTSAGQENFQSIVARMHEKQRQSVATDSANTFNTALYADLQTVCAKLGNPQVETPKPHLTKEAPPLPGN